MGRTLLALILLCSTSGCFPGPGFGRGRHRHGRGDGLVAFLQLATAAVELGAVIHAANAQPPPPPPPPPPPQPTARPFVGGVRWETGEPVAFVRVTLRGTQDFVVLQAMTDQYGTFVFPLPLPGDWYRITLDENVASGGALVWLSDRGPPALQVIAHPRQPYSD